MSFPETLVRLLANGKIIPFVGAGVSRAVIDRQTGKPLFPSWKELLENAAARLDHENKANYGRLVRSLIDIDEPDYLSAARYAKESLGSTWFDLLRDEFSPSRSDADDDSLATARAIWKLKSNLIITTNYDRVLSWSSDYQDDLTYWNIEAPAEQAAVMRSGSLNPVVWHLHGRIDDAAKIVLTSDSYELLYSSSTAESMYPAAMASLRSLLSSRSLLFIGFSFTDAALGVTLRHVNKIYAGATGPHYALVHREAFETARKARLDGIELIPFADYGQPLIDTIIALSKHCEPHPTTPVPLQIHIDSANHESELNTPKVADPVADGFDDSCDAPPPTGTWVGRADELKLLSDPTAKVISVTGIGGQGKSTLVARFLEEHRDHFTFLDWRDCKEEANTIHTHLVRIIERLTKGRRRASDLASETFESIVRTFLTLSISQRGVFVFDNIDRYVEVNNALAVKGMHTLIEGALRSPGASKFIFTTRPKLYYENPYFSQIELHGLNIDETRELFSVRQVDLQPSELEELHELLQGHPLWIGLVARQVVTNKLKISVLIERIRNGKEAGLPNTMLREIWSGLKPKQQKLLRYLAEFVRPEAEGRIKEIASKDFSPNQIRTTMANLKALDLVVVKSQSNGMETIELHPLVREFVRRQFSINQRTQYIAKILIFVDRAIEQLRPILTVASSFDTLQHWTMKVELLMNCGDYKQALKVLDEADEFLRSSGYSEDFVRLAERIFGSCDWGSSELVDTNEFEDICAQLVVILSELGRFRDAEDYLKRFEHTTAGATARYISVCRLRAYFYWSQQDYELAKEWGQRGVQLKASSDIDTRYDSAHDLALAQRDSGETEAALRYFLDGADIKSVTEPSQIEIERGAPYYGNIGRTLFLMGRLDEAKSCITKSAWLLEHKKLGTWIDAGWASCWLGEVLEKQQAFDESYICFRHAADKWRDVSPYRADKAIEAVERLTPNTSSHLASLNDEQIEHKFHVWLDKMKQF